MGSVRRNNNITIIFDNIITIYNRMPLPVVNTYLTDTVSIVSDSVVLESNTSSPLDIRLNPSQQHMISELQ